MFWRRRPKEEDEKAIEEAREERDQAFDELDQATEEVDRVHDRIIADYEAAEEERLKR